MTIVELEKTPLTLREAAQLARDGVLILTEDGKPAFALVDVKDDLALEVLALSRNESFMAYLDEISEHAKSEPTYSLAELREKYAATLPPDQESLS